MRRWNGWGDDTIGYPLPAAAVAFLGRVIGPGSAPRDATLEEVLATVGPSRLPEHHLVNTQPVERLRRARGQSLPDWIALRSGRVPAFPDGVARPTNRQEVRTLIEFAASAGAQLIPYGGGTSVVGHINPQPGERPALTVDMRRLADLIHLDEVSNLATFGAGVQGPEIEALLRARGFTLGHYPQSFELSTLGGWIATRSCGQQSLGYGRIEDLFAGGQVETPVGTLDLPPFPASAAGPDLRHWFLGCEGRFGIITRATVRVKPLPEREEFHAVFFPEFQSGMVTVRQMVQSGLSLSMLRLSTAAETATTLIMAGHEMLVATLNRLLSLRGLDEDKCMLLLGFTGSKESVRQDRRTAIGMAKEAGGVHVGRAFGNQWHRSRFRTPYLRNSLWEVGYAVDTVETALSWAHVPQTIQSMEEALRSALSDKGERVHVFTHLSHMYPQGASIYTTYLFRLAADPEESLARWQRLKTAVSEAILACGGTISHQHGVGTDHAHYLVNEKGRLGMEALADLARRFDPRGILNPGKLID